MYYQELLNTFVKECQKTIGNRLTGIYLHGSMAMGCFNPDKSDIDLIVILQDNITNEQKISLMEQIVKLNKCAPAKGLEISFVKREYCKPFVYPTPFELHFSLKHLQWFNRDPIDYVNKMKGEDVDLAAHFTILNQCGIRLYGGKIADVFGAVPRKAYADSIWHDIEDAEESILDNSIYITLNLCRVLAYLKDNLILSKEEGGEWGIAHMEKKYNSFIRQALRCYKSNLTMQADENIAKEFAYVMLEEIKEEIEKI